jgi:hypothetical protein
VSEKLTPTPKSTFFGVDISTPTPDILVSVASLLIGNKGGAEEDENTYLPILTTYRYIYLLLLSYKIQLLTLTPEILQ